MKGDYKSAVKNATKTLEIYKATDNPHLPECLFLLGISYYYDNDNAKAKNYIEQAKKSGFDVPQEILNKLEIE